MGQLYPLSYIRLGYFKKLNLCIRKITVVCVQSEGLPLQDKVLTQYRSNRLHGHILNTSRNLILIKDIHF